MRFALGDEHRGFAGSLDGLLTEADTPATARSWHEGRPEAGLELWRRLAGLGVTGLLVPERAGGLGASPVDLVVAFEAIGRHAVPGPWVESAACLPVLLAGVHSPDLDPTLGELATGSQIGTLAAPPTTPLALDADVATCTFLLDDKRLSLAEPGSLHLSVDPARRLFDLTPSRSMGAVPDAVVAAALDTAALACAAQLLGLGEHLLAESVRYAGTRRQFGRAIGEFQALKHALADVRVSLDFARPLLHAAALSLAGSAAGGPWHVAARDVSAAKVAAGDSAYRAARTALQVHGAVGYTAEHSLGLWLTKVRALVAAWGTASWHRGRVLELVTAAGVEPVETGRG
jgi:alkylation response protein AidB-like acyl-CoA dehydrogenase